MDASHSTKPPSNGSLLLLLQVLHDRMSSMDRRVQTIETTLMQGLWRSEGTATPAAEQSMWSSLKEAVTAASLVHRAWQMAKLVPWVGMGIEGFRLLFRLLGLH